MPFWPLATNYIWIANLSTTIQTRLRKQQLPQFELAIKQQGNVEQNSFSMELKDTAESVKMDVEGTLNLVTGSGDGRLSVRSLDLPILPKR